jgi:hypothetical protein
MPGIRGAIPGSAEAGGSRSALPKVGFAEAQLQDGPEFSIRALQRCAVGMLLARPPAKPIPTGRSRFAACPASACGVKGVGQCPGGVHRRFSGPCARCRYVGPVSGCDQRVGWAGAWGQGPTGLGLRSLCCAAFAALSLGGVHRSG